MQLRSKIIVIVILLSLVFVCGYQLYWLTGFYNDQYEKLEKAIANSMHHAGFKELAMRHTVTDDGENVIFDSANYGNFNRFDTYLTAEFKVLGINIPYYIEYTDIKSGDVLCRCSKSIENLDSCKFKAYSLPLVSQKGKAYCLYLYQPKWHIFKNMLGLVFVSVLVILLLVGSYVYLLRVIWLQKTLDEIKSDFVSNMTHELKTPITTAFTAIDFLQNLDCGNNPEKRKELLLVTRNQLKRLNSLVEKILALSVKKNKVKLVLESIPVGAIFKSVQNQFLVNATKKIIFEIDVPEDDLYIDADRVHFISIITNLIENAINFCDKDTVVIKLSAVQNKSRIVVSVSDNGMGIPSDLHHKIFEKFYRVPTGNVHNVKGHGLGLFYVQKAIETHGWGIHVKSTMGKGSCFELIIC